MWRGGRGGVRHTARVQESGQIALVGIDLDVGADVHVREDGADGRYVGKHVKLVGHPEGVWDETVVSFGK